MQPKRLFTAAAVAAFAFCSAPAPALAQAGIVRQVSSVMTDAGPIVIENVAGGLDHPWGMTFLPDGRALITERAGQLRILGRDGALSKPFGGTPNVFAQGQGGLLDVALDPEFASNQLGYLSFSAPGPGGSATTALGRGRWQNDSIANFQVIFREQPWITGPYHFGGRIVFDGKGHLFLTLGERFQFQPAQDLSSHLGSIVRLNHDGSIPRDNPFVGRPNAEPAIAPSGMIFYTGDAFPAWRGSALIGGLVTHGLVRVTMDGNRVTGEDRIPLGARIRDVEQGPDGMIYVLTDKDDGNVWRLVPLRRSGTGDR